MLNRILRALRAEREPAAFSNTVADPVLRRDVLMTVLLADMISTGVEPDPCPNRTIARIEVLEIRPRGPDLGRASWTERWTVDRCGMLVPYTIDFTPTDDGGNDYAIREPISLGTVPVLEPDRA